MSAQNLCFFLFFFFLYGGVEEGGGVELLSEAKWFLLRF